MEETELRSELEIMVAGEKLEWKMRKELNAKRHSILFPSRLKQLELIRNKKEAQSKVEEPKWMTSN